MGVNVVKIDDLIRYASCVGNAILTLMPTALQDGLQESCLANAPLSFKVQEMDTALPEASPGLVEKTATPDQGNATGARKVCEPHRPPPTVP
jgi:hypothetical protein